MTATATRVGVGWDVEECNVTRSRVILLQEGGQKKVWG